MSVCVQRDSVKDCVCMLCVCVVCECVCYYVSLYMYMISGVGGGICVCVCVCYYVSLSQVIFSVLLSQSFFFLILLYVCAEIE